MDNICLVLSCKRHLYTTRRHANVTTFKHLADAGFRVIFLFADPTITESCLEPFEGFESLTVKSQESYETLSNKMYEAYKYFVNTPCKGILKIDDKTKISPHILQELKEYTDKYDYLGIKESYRLAGTQNEICNRIPGSYQYTYTRPFNYFSGGFYWVSNTAMQTIVKEGLMTWAEDLAVGYSISSNPSLISKKIEGWFNQYIQWESYTPLKPFSVYFLGGLGNQLFQAAVGYAYAKKYDRRLILAESSYGRPATYYNTFMYNIKNHMGNISPGLMWKEPTFAYRPIPEGYDSIYGYFQSTKYFNDISGEIRKLFDPNSIVKSIVMQKYGDLLNSIDNKVIIHVRRTDYLVGTNNLFHAVTTDNYYKRAIAYMKQKLHDPSFLVFSDDINWCKEQDFFEGANFVDERTDYLAMHLMSQFKHYIIPNSTFAWWAVWLGTPAETVIVPDRWFGPIGPQDYEDIYEPNWIKISCD